MNRSKNISHFFFSLIFFALGLLLAIPNRNYFGNPKSEVLIQKCIISESGTTIRLYQGPGNDWYSVTYKQPGIHREKQFFYTYHTRIEDIKCEQESVFVLMGNEKSRIFNDTQIRESLSNPPVGLYRGEEQIAEPQIIRLMVMITAIFMFRIGWVSIFQLAKRPQSQILRNKFIDAIFQSLTFGTLLSFIASDYSLAWSILGSLTWLSTIIINNTLGFIIGITAGSFAIGMLLDGFDRFDGAIGLGIIAVIVSITLAICGFVYFSLMGANKLATSQE